MAESINNSESNYFNNGDKINSNPTLRSSASFSEVKKETPHSLEKLECQLKELWAQYIHCLDKYGLNETARGLKQRYLNLYQNYKNFRDWKDAVGGN